MSTSPNRQNRPFILKSSSRYLRVLLAKQVVYCLDRIECDEWDLYENGIPETHGPVPETGEFECLEFLAILRLDGDKSSVGIGKVQ